MKVVPICFTLSVEMTRVGLHLMLIGLFSYRELRSDRTEALDNC
jgi:hypothetical protein